MADFAEVQTLQYEARMQFLYFSIGPLRSCGIRQCLVGTALFKASIKHTNSE
jgi:hypothetical protein